MAGRIQGITVEIGGDTTKLQTAFDILFCISPSVFCHLHQMSGQNFRYIV